MNDLKTLINEEYKDITFDMKASYIISLYEKERRKKAGVFVTTAVCLFMIMTVFIRMNPKTVKTLMNSTGKFFSNLVSNNTDKLSVSETTSPPQPNTSDNLINQIATSTAPDDKREYKKPNKSIIRPVAVKPTGVMEETRVDLQKNRQKRSLSQLKVLLRPRLNQNRQKLQFRLLLPKRRRNRQRILTPLKLNTRLFQVMKSA